MDIALLSELVEFSLERILTYAAQEKLAKKKKPNGTENETTDVPVIERTIVCHNKCPVPLPKALLASYAGNGLEPLSRGTYNFTTEAFELRAGTIDTLLLSIYNKQRGNSTRAILLSINIHDESEKKTIFDEIRFMNNKIKKCRQHFTLRTMKLELTFDPKSRFVTTKLHYHLVLRPLFYRYFSSDVTTALIPVLRPHVVPYPTVNDEFVADFAKLPIDAHLFYKVITDNTARMPAATSTFFHPHLLTDLLPFQRKSVGWLLKKEGVTYDLKKHATSPTPLISDEVQAALASFPDVDHEWLDQQVFTILTRLCFGWDRVLFRSDICWLNEYTGNIMTREQVVSFLLLYYQDSNLQSLPGQGLLSEEMGLGKTVEIMDLVLLNPRPALEVGLDIRLQFEEEGDFHVVKKAKTTLIAAPESILRQWYSEISRLCPSLLVTIYKGLGKYPELANVPRHIGEYLRRFDIVLTNYATMSRETDYATYSSRHIPTRGGKKRSYQEEDEVKDTPPTSVDAYKAEFTVAPLSTSTDLTFNQKQYDRAVMEELAAKVRREDPKTIPHTQFYESPLMLSQWWRVVLDEVQMVSSGASKAFKTAALIPRFHSWGVSGTPARLVAVLQFLKYQPFSYDTSKYCWKVLTNPLRSNADFVKVWLNLALRHTKAMVHDDIKLPPQQRILLTIPFTKVEQDKYNQMYESCLAAIGIYNDNKPKEGELSSSACVHLRSWLVKLRQLCGNLQIGNLPKAHKGKNRSKFLIHGLPELKTLENVLDDMIDKVLDEISEAERGVIGKLLEIGQLLEYVLHPDRVIEYLNIGLYEIRKVISRIDAKNQRDVSEYQRLRSILNERGALHKKDMDDISDDEDDMSDDEAEETVKPKQEPIDDKDFQIQDALHKFLKYKELVASNRIRLRSWRMLQHKCYFLLASAHFQLYDPEYQEKITKLKVPFDSLRTLHSTIGHGGLLNSDEIVAVLTGIPSGKVAFKATDYLAQFKCEDHLTADEQKVEKDKFLELAYYDLAEECRKDILKHAIKDVHQITTKRITSRDAIEPGDWLNDGSSNFPKSSKKLFKAIPDIEISALVELVGGVKTKQLMDQVAKLVAELNEHAHLINENVSHLVQVLCNPLLTTDKTPDGEEYEQSIQDQDQASCLMLVLSQLLMDRSNAVLEMKTKISEINKQQDHDLKLEAQRVGDKKFLKELQAKRLKAKPSSRLSFEELLQDARLLENEMKDDHRHSTQMATFQEVAVTLRTIFDNEKMAQSLLQRELNSSCNAVFNARVEYFKQLQQISDSVQPKTYTTEQESLEPDKIDYEFAALIVLFSTARGKLARGASRFRYLATLVPKDADGVKKEDAIVEEESDDGNECIICQSPITVGTLTSCGHKFCKTCLDEWLNSHSSCPICKTFTNKDTVYHFTHYKSDLKAQAVENGHHTEHEIDAPTRQSIHQVYKQMDPEVLRKIQNIKLTNSYGSKVDLIVRQILHLRNLDPDVQIVIFSQWQDLLVILACAFDMAKITYVSAKGTQVAAYSGKKDPVEEFKNKTNIKTCFLLNAQAQASGLTLINATHIFLCEPLVNTPVELQAISRIHRIGQKSVTTVWMFAIENTVEENIVALGTRKRLDYLKANAKEHPENSRQASAQPGPIIEKDLRTAESFALSLGQTSETTTGRVFSGVSEMVADSDLWNVYFGESKM